MSDPKQAGAAYDVENVFTYHEPTPAKLKAFVAFRNTAKILATLFLEDAPPTPERDLALRKLEESVMWANAAVARYPEVKKS